MENRITNLKGRIMNNTQNEMIIVPANQDFVFDFQKGMTRKIDEFTQEKPWYFRIYKMNINSELLKEYDESEYGADYTYTADDDSGRCYFDNNLTMFRMNDDWYVSIRCNGEDTKEEVEGFLEDAYWTIYHDMGLVPYWEKKKPTLVFFNCDIR